MCAHVGSNEIARCSRLTYSQKLEFSKAQFLHALQPLQRSIASIEALHSDQYTQLYALHDLVTLTCIEVEHAQSSQVSTWSGYGR